MSSGGGASLVKHPQPPDDGYFGSAQQMTSVSVTLVGVQLSASVEFALATPRAVDEQKQDVPSVEISQKVPPPPGEDEHRASRTMRQRVEKDAERTGPNPRHAEQRIRDAKHARAALSTSRRCRFMRDRGPFTVDVATASSAAVSHRWGCRR